MVCPTALIKLMFPNACSDCKISTLLLELGLGYIRMFLLCSNTYEGVKQSQLCEPNSVNVFIGSVSHSVVGSNKMGLDVTPCLILDFLISVLSLVHQSPPFASVKPAEASSVHPKPGSSPILPKISILLPSFLIQGHRFR